VKLIAVLSI